MRALLISLKRAVTRLHRDERGAEGLEKLLIIGAIVLPLLLLLIIFREALWNWVESSWESVIDRGQERDGSG